MCLPYIILDAKLEWLNGIFHFQVIAGGSRIRIRIKIATTKSADEVATDRVDAVPGEKIRIKFRSEWRASIFSFWFSKLNQGVSRSSKNF